MLLFSLIWLKMTKIDTEKAKKEARLSQTAAARAARWPGGATAKEDRWRKKHAEIVLFVARLGWATSELVNAYLRQKSLDWLKNMQEARLISLDKIILGDATVSRNLPNGRVATVIFLTEKGHRLAKTLDEKIRKRIARVNNQQTRHDLIAAWAAVKIINDRPDLALVDRDDIAIWSDQVLRQRLNKKIPRPDIAVMFRSPDLKDIAIEVERHAKKLGWPQFEFCLKLENFYVAADWRICVIVENLLKAETLSKFFLRAENPGLPLMIYSEFDKKWIETSPLALREFDLRLSLLVWDHEKKSFTDQFLHNTEHPTLHNFKHAVPPSWLDGAARLVATPLAAVSLNPEGLTLPDRFKRSLSV